MRLPAAYLLILFTAINTSAQDVNYGSAEDEYCFDIETISDSAGIPGKYKVYIQTPICEDANYFLITSFTEDQFIEFLPHVLQTFQQAEGYYLKHVIEEMPEIIVNDSLAQSYFAPEFHRLNYFYQVALLKKLNRHTLTAQMREALEEALDKRNSLRNELIRELLNEKDLYPSFVKSSREQITWMNF